MARATSSPRCSRSAARASALQRYKGLGEMNSEQLWRPRSTRGAHPPPGQSAGEADAADDPSAVLMGDEVDPRRQFIQDNALSVANLDV